MGNFSRTFWFTVASMVVTASGVYADEDPPPDARGSCSANCGNDKEITCSASISGPGSNCSCSSGGGGSSDGWCSASCGNSTGGHEEDQHYCSDGNTSACNEEEMNACTTYYEEAICECLC